MRRWMQSTTYNYSPLSRCRCCSRRATRSQGHPTCESCGRPVAMAVAMAPAPAPIPGKSSVSWRALARRRRHHCRGPDRQRDRLPVFAADGAPLADGEWLTVAAPGFLAEGGDLYTMFAESEPLRSAGKVTDVITEYFARQEIVEVPESGRQVDIAR